MIEICVPSVMHSGTHVLRYKILRAAFKNNESDGEILFNGKSKNIMHGFHVDQEHRFIDKLKTCPIFSPLRHPRRIAKSWQSRERIPARLPYNKENLYHQLDLLMDLDMLYGVHYLHVDHEIRDFEVELIENILNLGIKPDFSVDRRSGAIAGNHDVDLEECPEVPQKYIDFYFETIERIRE